jgi:aryl-alcohol dehydrogenase-like predicted oxidoreductase
MMRDDSDVDLRIKALLGDDFARVGLGCWQIGGDWGEVSDATALNLLREAHDHGVCFLDTASGYGGGRSEKLIGAFLPTVPERPVVATKIGRPGSSEVDLAEHLRSVTERSAERLGVETIDLTQLHCWPMELLRRPVVWRTLGELRDQGLVRHYGASVESMEEARFCMKQEGLASLQIIFSLLRQHPRDEIFEQASRLGVALIVRLPLASGLLSGKMTKATSFAENDHRHYNRDGAAFHVGETFAGLPFDVGVELVEQIKPLMQGPGTLAQRAIRWVLDHDAVTVVIPGASRPQQVIENAEAAALVGFDREAHERLTAFYREHVAPQLRGQY